MSKPIQILFALIATSILASLFGFYMGQQACEREIKPKLINCTFSYNKLKQDTNRK